LSIKKIPEKGFILAVLNGFPPLISDASPWCRYSLAFRSLLIGKFLTALSVLVGWPGLWLFAVSRS